MRLVAVIVFVATVCAFVAWEAQASVKRPLCYIRDPADLVMMTETANGLRRVHGFIRIKCVRKVDLITVSVCLHRVGDQTDFVVCRQLKVPDTSEVLAHISYLCGATARRVGWFVKGAATIYDRKAYGKASPLVAGPTQDWPCV